MTGHPASQKEMQKCPNGSADARPAASTKRTRKNARSTMQKTLKNALKYNDIHRDKLLICITITDALTVRRSLSFLFGNCIAHYNLLGLSNAYILMDYDRS